jgi:hypothetical protein
MILTPPHATPSRLADAPVRGLSYQRLRLFRFAPPPFEPYGSTLGATVSSRSWGSPPSMIDSSRLASLRPLPLSRGTASAHWYHPVRHVPPVWSCTTSAVCSAATLQACCVLLPVVGFDTFHGSCDVQANLSVITPAPRIAVSDPSKNTTHRQPYRVTAAVAPLAFLLVCATPRVLASGEPNAHRGTCACSEDQTVANATRFGLPHTSADMLTNPLRSPRPRGVRSLTPQRSRSALAVPTTRASRQLDATPRRPSITSSGRATQTSPRGWISAGDANLTVSRRHRLNLRSARELVAPTVRRTEWLWVQDTRENRSSRPPKKSPVCDCQTSA